MDPVLNYVQLVANVSALVVIGWIYAAYVKNLRSTIDLKNTELESLRANLQLWKDKADELERKSPDRLESVLAERIKIREDELHRLVQDRENHTQEIKERNSELEKLRYELQKVKDVGRAVVVWDPESKDQRIVEPSELELVKMGEVFVDAACLMICDPGYIREVWRDNDWDDDAATPRRFIDTKDGDIYEVGREIADFDKPLKANPHMTDISTAVPVIELIRVGRLKALPDPQPPPPYPMSSRGAFAASCSPQRYGSLAFLTGEEGAGMCFSTIYGDGTYSVYGEKFKDKLVRVYVELQ
jgi:hypothetical protein